MMRRGLAALTNVEGLDADAVADRLIGLRRVLDEADLVFARQLARFMELDGPRAGGAANAAQWLARHCRMRSGAAAAMTATATWLREVKETVTAFDAGLVGFGDVSSIAQTVDAAVDTARGTDLGVADIIEVAEPILLTAASEGMHPESLRRLGQRIRYQIDPKGSSQRQRSYAREAFFDLGQTADGAGVGRLQCDDAAYADIEAAVNHFAAPPAADGDQPQRAGYRRLRALVEVCRFALRHAHRTSGGRPAQVTLIVPVATLTDPETPPPGRTEWNTVLTAEGVLARMADGCEITPVYTTPDGEPLGAGNTIVVPPLGKPKDLGRDRRFFSSHQRLLYSVLYQTCTTPGCDRPLPWCDIDHVLEWRDLGPTDLANGRPRCRFHHVLKTKSRSP